MEEKQNKILEVQAQQEKATGKPAAEAPAKKAGTATSIC